MTAQETLHEARRRGVVLTPHGTFLRFRGPKNALGQKLKSELVKHKPEILALLRATHPCTTCGQFAFAEAGTACYWCRRGRREA